VMADIPGLIKGAAQGAGLGIRFLKHLNRTHLLLHIIDIAPMDEAIDPVADAIDIVAELAEYSPDLAGKERWLVLNKLDLLPEEEQKARCQQICEGLGWQGRIFEISAISGKGCKALSQQIMLHVEESALAKAEAIEQAVND